MPFLRMWRVGLRRLAALTCVLLLSGLAAPRARADALRRLDREMDGHRDRDEHDDDDDDDGGSHWTFNVNRTSGSSGSSYDDDDDSSGGTDSPFGRAIAMMILFPWSAPHLGLESPPLPGYAEPSVHNSCMSSYAAVPYQQGRGLLRNACDESTLGEKRSVLMVSGESGFMLQNVVPASFGVRLLLPKRFELSGRVDILKDLARAADQAVMATAHLNYRFAQSQYVDFRTGVGPRLFKLDELRLGADLLYAFDVYGKRPIVFRAELHAGFMHRNGSDKPAVFGQARATIGYMFDRVEVYAGYDHLKMADPYGPGMPLGGPIAGLRGWF
ncbi:MAG: hypothetical protein QM778_24260 [Myxococcales bacterium]